MWQIISCSLPREVNALLVGDPYSPRFVPSQSWESSRQSGFVLRLSLSSAFRRLQGQVFKRHSVFSIRLLRSSRLVQLSR